MILEIIALFSCGTFFGAAIYISLAQHPAVLEAGGTVGGQFFPPMYKRAASIQVPLALFGFVSGGILGYQSSEILWLAGALLLLSVIPITLVFIKPVNDILLSSETLADLTEIESLLILWGKKHWWRSIVSGASFLLYLYVAVND